MFIFKSLFIIMEQRISGIFEEIYRISKQSAVRHIVQNSSTVCFSICKQLLHWWKSTCIFIFQFSFSALLYSLLHTAVFKEPSFRIWRFSGSCNCSSLQTRWQNHGQSTFLQARIDFRILSSYRKIPLHEENHLCGNVSRTPRRKNIKHDEINA